MIFLLSFSAFFLCSLVKVLDDLEVFFFDRGQCLYLILAIFFGRFIDRLFMAYFSRIGEKLPAAG